MKRSMDDLLRDTLRARAADPTAACLDPESAAAFVDGAMSRRERAGAEAHVADCPRCQAVLAALVKSTPPPLERAWWRRPAVAWLAPLTVAATAVAIWISVPGTANLAPVQTLRDEAPRLESSPVQLPPGAGQASLQPQSQVESAIAARSVAAELSRAREMAAPSAKVRSVQTTPVAAAETGDARQAAAASPTPAAAPPPLAAAAPQASRADAEKSAPGAAQVVEQRQPAAAVEPNVDRRAIAAEPARPSALAETVAIATFRSAAPTTIVSSNRTSQWRIGNGSEVQHSADGGSTWRTQSTGVNVTPTGGSSPSPSVCWLVGRGGLVLITTDEGQSWRRVPFQVVTDLVSVRATDDRRATVVTSDGRTFVTSDGGRSWRQ
jgi:Photosynthesis system II assembly factor YCF48/Putative zinc-finger